MLVCSAIPLISSRISPIFWLPWPSASDRSAIPLTCCCICSIVSPVWCAALLLLSALAAIDAAVAPSSSIVAAAWAIDADCSLVAAAASRIEVRISKVASVSLGTVALRRSKTRRSIRTMYPIKPTETSTAITPAMIPAHRALLWALLARAASAVDCR